jgi:small subunit ribosomal protein S17
MNAEKKSLARTLVGRVVSNKMQKTVTVLVERRVKHPLYGKYIVKSNKYHAHDETDALNEGDVVEIAASRPLARTKTWTVTRVVETAQAI